MTHVHRVARLFGALALVAGLTAMTACSSPPTEELEAAQATIDSVKALDIVQTYGMSEVRDAEQTLSRARQLVTSKEYDQAIQSINQAQRAARGAVSAAQRNMEAAMQDAQRAISDATAAIAEANEAIPNAPRWGKGAIRDIDALKADVASAQEDLNMAQEQLDGEMYRQASGTARNAITKARAVTQTVTDAIELRESARRR